MRRLPWGGNSGRRWFADVSRRRGLIRHNLGNVTAERRFSLFCGDSTLQQAIYSTLYLILSMCKLHVQYAIYEYSELLFMTQG